MRRLVPSLVLLLAFALPGWGAAAETAAACTFTLGFKLLRDQIPQIVGDCVEDEWHGANGDALQRTTEGLLAWRKLDNWTAFTDGATTWINGPMGVQSRPNSERFPWEAQDAPPTPPPTPEAPAEPAVLVGAGDIASCETDGDSQTAALLDGIAGTVVALGDNVYEDGTADEFANCYGPTWGRHKDRTRPAVGNHEYQTSRAAGYFGYFGAAAGDPATGYYSYDAGAWHVVVLNSNCWLAIGCDAGSPQEQWLRADLAAHPTACTLAYWHEPLFSSGPIGDIGAMRPIWWALYDAGADVVLSGHDHLYERFAPQDPAGQADADRGIRQFTVGTGGFHLFEAGEVKPNSEVIIDDTYGVLKLTLHSTSYEWQFIGVDTDVLDAGSGACH